MEVTYNGVKVIVSEELEKVLNGDVPKICGTVCDVYIDTREKDFQVETGKYNSMGNYYSNYRRSYSRGLSSLTAYGMYIHKVEEEDKTLIYCIPMTIDIYSAEKKLIFNRTSNKSIRLFEIYEDKIEVSTVGKKTRKLELIRAMRQISNCDSYTWFNRKDIPEANIITQVTMYPYNQPKYCDVYTTCLQSPILYKFIRRGYLSNTIQLVADYEKYFNKGGETIEELTKIPLDVIEKLGIKDLRDYCDYVISQEEIVLSEQNRHIFNQFSKDTKRTFIELIKFYELDANECVNYVDNCKTYQGLNIDTVISTFAKVCFYNSILEEDIYYPDSLKWTHNKLYNKVTNSKEKPLSSKMFKFIYDKKDKTLKKYLDKVGVDFNFVDKSRSMFFNAKLKEVKMLNFRSNIDLETIDYDYDEKGSLVIYKNFYHVEFPSVNRAIVPEIKIVFIKKNVLYKITKNGTFTGMMKNLSNNIQCITDDLIKDLLKEPVFENTGVHILYNYCKKQKVDSYRAFIAITKYMRNYRHLECMLNRGLIAEVLEICSYMSTSDSFSGKDCERANSIKKVLYFFNKSQIDYVLSKQENDYHMTSFYDSCKYIYDNINYMDTDIMDLVAKSHLYLGYTVVLFEVGFITKQNIHAVLEYIIKLEKEDVGTLGEVVSLYRDYIKMSNKLNLPNSKRYPTDLIKAHDVAVQAYNAIKDEILAEEFRTVMSDYQQYNYVDEEEDYCIVVPKELNEIVQEGVELNHCVRSYTDRIINRQTLILFVREKENPEVPYFTLEIYNGYINQLRGQSNCAPPQEVKDFVDIWFKKKYKKLSKEAAKIAV